MATTMHCDIVSAEKEIFSGPVTMVIATGTLGELGILPGHAPLLTGIKPGPVRLQFENGEEDVFFASGGFLEVQPSVVTVLADTALHADDMTRRRRSRLRTRRNGRSPSRRRTSTSRWLRRSWLRRRGGRGRWRS